MSEEVLQMTLGQYWVYIGGVHHGTWLWMPFTMHHILLISISDDSNMGINPLNPYPLVDCPGYGVSGSMDCKKRPNNSQTNKILFKNWEQIYYSVTIETASVHHNEAGEPKESLSRRLNVIFWLLLPLVNDGIQSSHEVWLDSCTTILPLLVTFCLQSNILLFLKQFWTVLGSILCQRVRNQVLKSMDFAPRGVWVMGYCGCMGDEVPVNQLGGSMGYVSHGLRGSQLYTENFQNCRSPE